MSEKESDEATLNERVEEYASKVMATEEVMQGGSCKYNFMINPGLLGTPREPLNVGKAIDSIASSLNLEAGWGTKTDRCVLFTGPITLEAIKKAFLPIYREMLKMSGG